MCFRMNSYHLFHWNVLDQIKFPNEISIVCACSIRSQIRKEIKEQKCQRSLSPDHSSRTNQIAIFLIDSL